MKDIYDRSPKTMDNPAKLLEEIRQHLIIYFTQFETTHRKLTNPANFAPVAYKINVILGKESFIKPDYLCSIYNPHKDKSKTKSEEKLIAINEAMLRVIEKKEDNLISIPDWIGSKNEFAPQWAEHKILDLKNKNFKKLVCLIKSPSHYYRFGIKLLHPEGKLFGDATIQSQYRPEIVLHVGKNTENNNLFITSYINGIRHKKDRYTDIAAKENEYRFEVVFDTHNTVHLLINHIDFYGRPLGVDSFDILKRVVLYVWGDGEDPDPEVHIKNITLELSNC